MATRILTRRIAFGFLGLLALAGVAYAATSDACARNCTTTCYGSGNYRTCNTSCY